MRSSDFPCCHINTSKTDGIYKIPSIRPVLIETTLVVEPVSPYDGILGSILSIQNSRNIKRVKFQKITAGKKMSQTLSSGDTTSGTGISSFS